KRSESFPPATDEHGFVRLFAAHHFFRRRRYGDNADYHSLGAYHQEGSDFGGRMVSGRPVDAASRRNTLLDLWLQSGASTGTAQAKPSRSLSGAPAAPQIRDGSGWQRSSRVITHRGPGSKRGRLPRRRRQ